MQEGYYLGASVVTGESEYDTSELMSEYIETDMDEDMDFKSIVHRMMDIVKLNDNNFTSAVDVFFTSSVKLWAEGARYHVYGCVCDIEALPWVMRGGPGGGAPAAAT